MVGQRGGHEASMSSPYEPVQVCVSAARLNTVLQPVQVAWILTHRDQCFSDYEPVGEVKVELDGRQEKCQEPAQSWCIHLRHHSPPTYPGSSIEYQRSILSSASYQSRTPVCSQSPWLCSCVGVLPCAIVDLPTLTKRRILSLS